jgi:hypothetical protein
MSFNPRELFASEFIYDVMLKPTKIAKGCGIEYNGSEYLFISARLHSMGFIDSLLDVPYTVYDKTSKRKDAITKKITLHNIFTGEEEIYLVDGTTEGFDYII